MLIPTEIRRSMAQEIIQTCNPSKPTSLIIDGLTMETISRRTSESLDIAVFSGALESRIDLFSKTWFRTDHGEALDRAERYFLWLKNNGFHVIAEESHGRNDTAMLQLKHRLNEGNIILFGSSSISTALARQITQKIKSHLVWIYDDMSGFVPNISGSVTTIPSSHVASLAHPPHRYIHAFHRNYESARRSGRLKNAEMLSTLEYDVDRITASEDAMIDLKNMGVTSEQIDNNNFREIHNSINNHIKAV